MGLCPRPGFELQPCADKTVIVLLRGPRAPLPLLVIYHTWQPHWTIITLPLSSCTVMSMRASGAEGERRNSWEKQCLAGKGWGKDRAVRGKARRKRKRRWRTVLKWQSVNKLYEWSVAYIILREKNIFTHDRGRKKMVGALTFSNTSFNTPRNDGKECNLTNTPLANRLVFVLQMRTSCSDHISPTNCLTRQELDRKGETGPLRQQHSSTYIWHRSTLYNLCGKY